MNSIARTFLLFISLATLIDGSCLGADTDSAWNSDDIVYVLGKRKSADRSRTLGESTVFHPNELSDFDTVSLLKQETSVYSPETGKISASGFVVPRIRGQDVKLTEIFIEDMLIQDPYTQLPLIEDLDLRAFGTLEVHQGITPFDVPGFSPVGAVRYRFSQQAKDAVQVGADVGRPLGIKGWSSAHLKGQTLVDGRVYVRRHTTDGRFSYYSDNGTPFNTGDDSLRIRENNERNSTVAIPSFRAKLFSGELDAVALLANGERGIPSTSESASSSATGHTQNKLGALQYAVTRSQSESFGLHKASISLAKTQDDNSIQDPEQRFVITARESHLFVESDRINISVAQGTDDLQSRLDLAASSSSIRSTLDGADAVKVKRLKQEISLGLRGRSDGVEGELKFHKKMGHDKSERPSLGEGQSADGRDARTHGVGASVGYNPGVVGGYVQSGLLHRPPSLLEEFGDGTALVANPDVRPEVMHHNEVGLRFRLARPENTLGVAVFEDHTFDKIVFTPVQAEAQKALNLRESRIRGFDIHAEATVGQTEGHIGFSKFDAKDISGDDSQNLPFIPEKAAVIHIVHLIEPMSLKWLTRYQSEIFRDLSNSIAVGETWIHDVAMDSRFKLMGTELQAGMSVKNLLNTQSMPIWAPKTPGNRGKTSYSEASGDPLPGRQWVLSVAASLF